MIFLGEKKVKKFYGYFSFLCYRDNFFFLSSQLIELFHRTMKKKIKKNQARYELFRPTPLTWILFTWRTVRRVAKLTFLCQLSQIWHIPNWLAIKISCRYFRLKCQPLIFFYCQPLYNMPNLRKLAWKSQLGNPDGMSCGAERVKGALHALGDSFCRTVWGVCLSLILYIYSFFSFFPWPRNS